MGYLGNVSISLGVRRLFYVVTPNETSFEKLEDVPDYLNEVCKLNPIIFAVDVVYSVVHV